MAARITGEPTVLPRVAALVSLGDLHAWRLWGPMDCSLPGFSVHGILQARMLEWVAAVPTPGHPRDQTHVSMSPTGAGGFFTASTTWESQLLAFSVNK